jgi:hypothetical protein
LPALLSVAYIIFAPISARALRSPLLSEMWAVIAWPQIGGPLQHRATARGNGNRPIGVVALSPPDDGARNSAEIECDSRLGGLSRLYYSVTPCDRLEK